MNAIKQFRIGYADGYKAGRIDRQQGTERFADQAKVRKLCTDAYADGYALGYQQARTNQRHGG